VRARAHGERALVGRVRTERNPARVHAVGVRETRRCVDLTVVIDRGGGRAVGGAVKPVEIRVLERALAAAALNANLRASKSKESISFRNMRLQHESGSEMIDRVKINLHTHFWLSVAGASPSTPRISATISAPSSRSRTCACCVTGA
jgi:hypothetical protein